ncbi:MAG: PKD domain-containing protein [Thermoplasmatota archaeon]
MQQRWVFVLLLAAFVAGCLSAPPRDAAVPPSVHEAAPSGPAHQILPNVPLAPTQAKPVSSGSEPSILADRNGKYLWIGDTSGGYYSENNGTTWKAMGGYAGGNSLTLVDGWALAQDDAGKLYAGVLRDNRIDVVRSATGGQTWDKVGYAAGVSGSADRPWLAAKGDGEVALFYFDAPTVLFGFAEHCARSTDGGQTFLDRSPAAVRPGQGGAAFTDSEGAFYFSSNDGSLYKFASTCLGGGQKIPMAGGATVNNMLQGDADGTVLYQAAATGKSAAITLFGKDKDDAKSLQVSPPDLQSNTYATVATHDGQVAVAWYGSETSGDPSASTFGGDFSTYLAVVDGFWTATPTVTQYQVSPGNNHHGQICMGGTTCDTANLSGCVTRCLLDYFKVDYDIWGGIHVAYVDDTAGSSHVYHVHIPPKGPPAPPPTPPNPQAPLADFTLTLADKTASVDASGSRSPAGLALTYSWTWGDGAATTGVTSEHTYGGYGDYDVALTVADSAGRTATHSLHVKVDGQSIGPPVPDWEMEPAAPVAGEEVTFRDRSQVADGVAIVQASWDFGDGETAEGPEVTHTFAAAGTYAVTLSVLDDRGGSDSLAQDVVVLEPGTAPNGTRHAADSPTAVFGLLGLAWAMRRR